MSDFSLSGLLKESLESRASEQADSLEATFDEIPVDLSTFINDSRYLGTMPLSDIQYDVVRHIERIYFPDTIKMLAEHDDKWKPALDVPMKNTFTLQWAKSAGKGLTSRIAFLRVTYLLICLKNPQAYYNSPPNESIDLINVAPTARQAREIFFVPIKRMIDNTFLKEYAQPTNNEIRWPKGIAMRSGNGEGDSQEGYNPILSVTDEIDAFKSREAARSAGKKDPVNSLEKILDTLHSSGKSRFPSVYKEIRISYPRYIGSPIQKYTDAGKEFIKKAAIEGKTSGQYVSGPYATWEVNPVRHKEEFLEEYETDPVEAAAKYECRPSFAVNTYFRNDQAIDATFTGTSEPVKIAGYKKVNNSWEPDYIFSRDFIPIKGAIYSMHGDLAVSGDRAGIAMSHVVRKEEYYRDVILENGDLAQYRELRPIVKVDFVIAYEANLTGDDPMEIQIRWARELAYKLIGMGFKINRFTYDGYQSKDSMQLLTERGIESKRVSTDLSEVPWQTLRDLIYDGRLLAPRNELLVNELKSLSRLPGGKIDHPAHAGKDLADALACSIVGAIEVGGSEWDSKERAYYGGSDFDTGSIEEIGMPIGFTRDMLQWGDEIPN